MKDLAPFWAEKHLVGLRHSNIHHEFEKNADCPNNIIAVIWRQSGFQKDRDCSSLDHALGGILWRTPLLILLHPQLALATVTIASYPEVFGVLSTRTTGNKLFSWSEAFRPTFYWIKSVFLRVELSVFICAEHQPGSTETWITLAYIIFGGNPGH